MSAPRASVIVPLHNGEHFIAACLASVPEDAELIVVDDLSQDGAPEVVQQTFPHATLLRNERNLGFGATCNRGLGVSTAPIKVLLNSDARLHPGALDALVQAFDDPAVGIAGPRLVSPDGSHQVSAGWFPTPTRLLLGGFHLNDALRTLRPATSCRPEVGMARRDHEADRDVDWVMGTCLAIHERCLADVGGFDEGYFFYVEETDLCRRAVAAGWRVRYVAGGVVDHDEAGSVASPSDARRQLAGEARFMRAVGGRAAVVRWRIARVIGAAVKILLLAPAAIVTGRSRARLRWQASALRHAAFIRPSDGPPS